MQDTSTLIELGFERFPEWDTKTTGTNHFRKEINGKIFRAFEVNFNGPVSYVTMGEVTTADGRVKRWMDCCSAGSVLKKISQ